VRIEKVKAIRIARCEIVHASVASFSTLSQSLASAQQRWDEHGHESGWTQPTIGVGVAIAHCKQWRHMDGHVR